MNEFFEKLKTVNKKTKEFFWEGKTSQGHRLSLTFKGGRIHLYFVDRAGIKEGWFIKDYSIKYFIKHGEKIISNL